LAIETIQQAILQGGVVVIDEIGPMEIASRGFCQAVLEALESQAIVLGTIVQRSIPFTDGIKHHKHVTLIEVRLDNRDQLPDQILAMLSGLHTSLRRIMQADLRIGIDIGGHSPIL